MKKFNLAIVGATGNVGREILNILIQRKFPYNKIFALASKKSEGADINIDEKKTLKVENLENFDFKKVEIVLSSAGSKVSKSFVPIATKSNAVVIDNTSLYRMHKDIPLIIPEVNPKEIAKYKKKKIIANPNCSTIQMLMALKPLHDKFTIKRIIVSTYQSTSGAGKTAMDELFHQTLNVYKNKPLKNDFFTKNIAFNVIPHIDKFLDNGQTKEEWKMVEETKKILDRNISIFSTCVRVPVFIGHAESVNIETIKPIDEKKATACLKKFPGVSVVDHRKDGGYVTPEETSGEDYVYVSRIRKDSSVKNGLGLWIAADNLRKGAALNSVQIAEELIKNHL
ncbi:MAG: aspartate-semialdehyde dehydrogenase [Rickettsiales bacterium]|nr:aspartate-semialdehyde dehydrogenase [Rickettsiales bacterium]